MADAKDFIYYRVYFLKPSLNGRNTHQSRFGSRGKLLEGRDKEQVGVADSCRSN